MRLFIHNKYVPLKINTCEALLNTCQATIDQSIRHFGIRHSGNHPFFHLLLTFPSTSFVPPSPSSFTFTLPILSLYSPSPLLLPPAPPGQVDNTTVRSENLSLRRTQLTWIAPEDNNAPITNYWITYCILIIDTTNDTCAGQTTIPVRNPTVPMVELTDIRPLRRYRVTIQAENVAGRGPESQPYFFDSPTAGRCKLVTPVI